MDRSKETMSSHLVMKLGISGFSYEDLFHPAGLRRLHAAFLERLAAVDSELAKGVTPSRFNPGPETGPETEHRPEQDKETPASGLGNEINPGLGSRLGSRLGSKGKTALEADAAFANLLVKAARHVSQFLATLFGVSDEREARLQQAKAEDVLFRFRREFVRWRSTKRNDPQASNEAFLEMESALLRDGIPVGSESDLAAFVMSGVDEEASLRIEGTNERRRQEILDRLDRIDAYLWQRLSVRDRPGPKWVSLDQPRSLDFQRLVHIRRPNPFLREQIEGPTTTQRSRDGFQLTDSRMSSREVAAQVEYCVYCHDRGKDSCSKGLRDKTGAYKKNPLGVTLGGCPLDERISEAHLLMKEGDVIAALAMICIDNPMLPGTGHRICNDCMKSCIYQKQEPVNIPQIETRILTDCLALPYGFEIYSLLTRWNPLRLDRPYALPYRGQNIAVIGMGPAGYTLAHHLLNEGFGVVGLDGLKVEPLPPALMNPEPIRNIADHFASLDERTLSGFGGVSEYGITVRWDKNFLQVIYLNLARRTHFRVYGGVRFGGTLELDDLWSLGFSHVAIATGAGRPTLVDIKNNLVRGIRKASDFLMALQLSGAFKRNSLANLQIRLPALVIGAGLTAIDTATELSAYYVVQAEKALARYEALSASLGENAVLSTYTEEEREILSDLLEHGRAIRWERQSAATEGRPPAFAQLIAAWGGVSLVYRKSLEDSPAYRLNHEEVEKCLEEGIRFLEKLSPKEAVTDRHGAVRALICQAANGQAIELPARTILVAAGTSPNVIYEKEHPGTFVLDGKNQFFLPHRIENGIPVPSPDGFFTSYRKDDKCVSFFGDNHPRYAGSVVRAMASAKDGYPEIVRHLDRSAAAAHNGQWRDLIDRLDRDLRPRVVEVKRLTSTIVEVLVSAPQAARKFQPGMFYRLQNFEAFAPVIDGTRLLMEGTALTGAWVDSERGLLSLIVLEMGSSSRLCAALKPGEEVVVMGPTGAPTEIPRGETIILCGGGLGNAVLFSIARALRNHGCSVVYFAGYKRAEDLFKQDEIEATTDQIVWSVDRGDVISPRRPHDLTFRGNIVEAMQAYARNELGTAHYSLRDARRLIAIGSDRMMAAIAQARRSILAPYLSPNHTAIGSINSPMQCMMKEICAQCLQRHVDPQTGKEQFIFSCFNQDQPLDQVDFEHLHQRLRQNTVAEKLSNLWLDRLLSQSRGPNG